MEKNIEIYETEQVLQKRNRALTVGVDHGMLRIQFPSKLSSCFWGQKQKYFYLGLKENPENLLLAELLIKEIQLDVIEGELDLTLERYQKTIKDYQSKKQPEQQTNVIKDFFLKGFQRRNLSILFDTYCEYKRPVLAETTLLDNYRRRYARALQKCPQNLSDGLKIRNHLLDNHPQGEAKRLLGVISSMVDWAKRHGYLPADFSNVYFDYAAQIKPIFNRETATSIQELIDAGVVDPPEPEIRAYTLDEAQAIIEAFEKREFLNNRSGTPWDLIVKFLFWTGCRHGECAALWWSDIALDCSKVYFRSSYDSRLKIRKALKTAGYGATSRTFPCGSKLQKLLLSLRPENYNSHSYVFTNRVGDPINYKTLHMYWTGTRNRETEYPGILVDLIKQGKVKQYLPPYATRHTYINLQLNAEVKPQDVARLVGNSPATIFKYYISASRQPITPIEV